MALFQGEYGAEDVAALLNVDVRTVLRMLEDGRLPDRRIRTEDGSSLGVLRFNKSDVESVFGDLEKDFEKARSFGMGFDEGDDLKQIVEA